MKLVTLFSLMLAVTILVSCSEGIPPNLKDQVCEAPALRAATEIARVATDMAEAYCYANPTVDGCDQKVVAARGVIDGTESTMNDVCAVLPALESLPCDECKPVISQAKKLACTTS